MPGKKINNDGFTLIEVMIALTIFAVGLLALADMQITGIKGNSTAQSLTAKVAAGTGIISQILALSGDSTEGLDTDNDGNVEFENFLNTNRTNETWTLADPIDRNGSWTVAIDVDGACQASCRLCCNLF
jgi:type IV pilus assembly protein PilV